MSSPTLSIFLLVVFLILNILDAHSTWLVLKPDHYYREKNIIARFFFRKLGLFRGIVFFKSFLLLFLALIIKFFLLPEYLTLNVSIAIGNSIFLIVVLNNYRIFRRLARSKLR